MRAPLDWNGNGGIDPVDIGITAGLNNGDSERDAGSSNKGEPTGAGCLPATLALFSLAVLPFALLCF
jgi:hypothetical protein